MRSAVIRLTRNNTTSLGCDEKLFKRLVKTTFNQRRKTLRNNIRPLLSQLEVESQGNSDFAGLLADPIMTKRPEQLSVQDFINLTLRLQKTLQLPLRGDMFNV